MAEKQKLGELNIKYGKFIRDWLLKFRNLKERYEFYSTVNKLLLRGTNEKNYDIIALEKILDVDFGHQVSENEILVLDSDNEEEIPKCDLASQIQRDVLSILNEAQDPIVNVLHDAQETVINDQNCLKASKSFNTIFVPNNVQQMDGSGPKSTNEYVLKSLKLRPAKLYATKPSTKERKIISIEKSKPHNNIKPLASFDPKEEAIKLSCIKEKIYAKTFLQIERPEPDLTKSLNGEKSIKKRRNTVFEEVPTKPVQRSKLRSRTKSQYHEAPIMLDQIPIQYSKRSTKYEKPKKQQNPELGSIDYDDNDLLVPLD